MSVSAAGKLRTGGDAATPAPRGERAPIAVVIDDDPRSRRAVVDALAGDGVCTLEAANATQASTLATIDGPDIFVVSLDSRTRPGLDVCRELRQLSRAPIIALSRERRESAVVAAFEAGADDYVTKPIRRRELAVRVGVRLRRSPRVAGPGIVVSDGLTLDFQRRIACRADVRLRLSRTEWEILGILASRVGEAVNYATLTAGLWNRAVSPDSRRRLRVHVTYLRAKLERSREEPQVLLTEPGFGYRLVGQVQPAAGR